MGHTPATRLREKLLRQARRDTWLKENGPCKRCGSIEELQVDHIDPFLKVDHKVWSWSETRRMSELAKCQVLCKPCHIQKTIEENGWNILHGGTRYRQGCRCDVCKNAQRLRVQNQRLNRLQSGVTVTR